MKFLFALAALALFAVINANPYGYGSRGGYGHRVGYLEDNYNSHRGYGGYGHNRGGYGGYERSYSRPLYSSYSKPAAAAAAAAAASGVRPGNYKQESVVGYNLDSGYHGDSYGHRGYGY